MKRLLFLFLLSPALHAQVALTPTDVKPILHIRVQVRAQLQLGANGTPIASVYVIPLTWGLPAGQCATGDAITPCTFCVYRSVHGANTYVLAGCTTTANATTYVDNSTAIASGGGSWDYEAFTEFTPTGSTTPLVSVASNTYSIVVPPLPAPVTAVTATAAGQN